MNEKPQTEYEKIAALIAATANEEKIKQFAEEALKKAATSWDVENAVKKELTPKVIEQASILLETNEYKIELKKIIEKEMIGIISSSVEKVCADMIEILRKSKK